MSMDTFLLANNVFSIFNYLCKLEQLLVYCIKYRIFGAKKGEKPEKLNFFQKNRKKVAEKFAGLKFCRTFAIPINQAVVVKW